MATNPMDLRIFGTTLRWTGKSLSTSVSAYAYRHLPNDVTTVMLTDPNFAIGMAFLRGKDI